VGGAKNLPIFCPPRRCFSAQKKLYKCVRPITVASATGCGWLTRKTPYIVVFQGSNMCENRRKNAFARPLRLLLADRQTRWERG
jgi:hypothetical protein